MHGGAELGWLGTITPNFCEALHVVFGDDQGNKDKP